MRRKLVLGNWKMHGSQASIQSLVNGLKASGLENAQNVDVGVFPTLLHIPQVVSELAGSAIAIGAQNGNAAEQGAFTGEVSVSMLLEAGATYCLVGHSERRELFAETDAVVAEKFAASQAAGLIPVLCVGESLPEREQGLTSQVVIAQLDAVLDRVGVEALAKAVIAYEPLWAIGTGKTASPEQAQAVHKSLRDHVAANSEHIAQGVRLIYGGSVKSANAAELFKQADIDGGLVGGASLSADEFIAICKSADIK
jgi:triosephosphate isomerase (TIM)